MPFLMKDWLVVRKLPVRPRVFGIRGVIDQYERELPRERTMRGRKERARSELIVGGRVPYGYVTTPVASAKIRNARIAAYERILAVISGQFRMIPDRLIVHQFLKPDGERHEHGDSGNGTASRVSRRRLSAERDDRLGGGSPRNVPSVIAPDIGIPQSGQARHVFAWP